MNDLICIDCGNKVEEGKCKTCQKKIASGMSLDIRDYYVEKELIKRNGGGPFKEERWPERLKRNHNNIRMHFNCCNNCEYFMYHPLNYCYKCGNKLVLVDMKAGEFAEKYPNYREGY